MEGKIGREEGDMVEGLAYHPQKISPKILLGVKQSTLDDENNGWGKEYWHRMVLHEHQGCWG